MEGNFPQNQSNMEHNKGFRTPSEINPAFTRYFQKTGGKSGISKIHKLYSDYYKS